MAYPMSEYKLDHFEKAKNPAKKYDAIIQNRKTKKYILIPFGSSTNEHYRDSTPLKIYSHLDHNDEVRKKNFKNRFKRLYHPKYYSPTYFSWNYLWI